jgi:hypothetical protein
VIERVSFVGAQVAEEVILDKAEPSVGETELVLAQR